MKRLIFTVALFLAALQIKAQTPLEKKADSTQKGLQAYTKVIPPNAEIRNGMFTVSRVDTKYYFEIPDSLIRRYMLVVTRYITTPQGIGNFGGEKANEQTIYFEKGMNNMIYLRAFDYRQDVRKRDAMLAKAIAGSDENPIVAAFPIKAINPVSGNIVIEVTDAFKKDNPMFSLAAREKTEKKLTSLADDRSFIESIGTYPINIEVKTTKTYSGPNSASVTLRFNTSIVLLPKNPMRKRFADERVGYFANKLILFDDDEQRAQNKYIIQRYRLEPRDKDLSKYQKGELVEPKKQIVYYIDPATPKKWRPYLIAGINDWQKAFEAAGFKNAIVGKEWPESDTTMSLEDARFSVVRYFASETPNAYGPRISDPRSGEIIESHVGWYHNVMKLVQNWYMVQVGPLDPRARKMHLDDELMGQLIRFVSSHEIGHTIGLRHNMGASSATPVEKLRDKKWVEENGHTVSIMDYARFNYVAQPEDNIGLKGIYPRIGIYDKWAIKWGYSYFDKFKDEFEEEKYLTSLTTERLTADPRLWFGGEGNDEDPRSQKEDLGDDAVLASDYGIKNLKRVVPNLIEWTYEPGDAYNNLAEMHKSVVRQYSRYLYHSLKYIGNNFITKRTTDEKAIVFQPVPKSKVKSVIGYLDRQLFNPPLWMYPKEIAALIPLKANDEISDQQNQVLNMLLSPGLLYNIGQKSLQFEGAYTIPEFLNDLQQTVWVNFSGEEAIDTYRRSLQRGYIEKLVLLLLPKDYEPGKALTTAQRSDVRLYGKLHLMELRAKVVNLSATAKGINSEHFKSILTEIDQILSKLNTTKS